MVKYIRSADTKNEYDIKDDISAINDKYDFIVDGLYQISEGSAKDIISELKNALNTYIVELAGELSSLQVTAATNSCNISTVPEFTKAAADIKVENEGILEVPQDKSVEDLSVSHFKKLIDKKGREAIIRALTNLEVWNKNDNKSLSSWAKKMKKSLEGYGETK